MVRRRKAGGGGKRLLKITLKIAVKVLGGEQMIVMMRLSG
jgi:hypothetical protein